MPSILKTIGSVDADPRKRTFGGLTRQADGTFADDDVARVLHDATEKAAGAYRGRGSPGVLRLVECLGITQARQWGVCTMNEFRVFLGLKKFETFEEWNPDPEIAVRTGDPLLSLRVLIGALDRTRPGSCMATSTTWSCTLVFRQR